MRFVFLIVYVTFFNYSALAENKDYIVLSDIVITGNEKTKSNIILRELDFEKGDTLNIEILEKKLSQSKNKLINLQLFLHVNLAIINCEPPFAELQINLAEQFFIFPFPVFRLADRSFNEWWYNRGHKLNRTIYGVNLVHLNVGGRAEEFILNLENGFTKQLALIYRKPYIDKMMKTGLDFELVYNTNKQIAYKTDFDKLVFARSDENVLLKKFSTRISLNRRNNFYVRQKFEIGYFKESLSDSISGLNPNYFLNKQTEIKYLRLRYIYDDDHRNNIVYANQGYFFRARLGQSGIFKSDNFRQFEVYLLFAKYLKLSPIFYADINFRTKFTNPKLQPFAIQQGLGYKNENVRGYDLNVIDGQKFGILKTNFRAKFLDSFIKIPGIGVWKSAQNQPFAIYGRLFYDGGYVKNHFAHLNNSILANKYISGYGLGVDLVSIYSGALRISYSFNDSGKKGLFFDFGKEF